MCAAYAAWGLFGIIAAPLGHITWLVFWAFLLPSVVIYRDPQVARSRKARAFIEFGVPLLGVCVVMLVAISIAVPDRAKLTRRDMREHHIQIGWTSDKSVIHLLDGGASHKMVYAWSLVDWSIDDRYVYGFADDPKDGSIVGYVGRPLGRFYLVLELDTLKFGQYVSLEDAPPGFREKLASLQTDPRRRRHRPFLR
jgi:hypothetical protein